MSDEQFPLGLFVPTAKDAYLKSTESQSIEVTEVLSVYLVFKVNKKKRERNVILSWDIGMWVRKRLNDDMLLLKRMTTSIYR